MQKVCSKPKLFTGVVALLVLAGCSGQPVDRASLGDEGAAPTSPESPQEGNADPTAKSKTVIEPVAEPVVEISPREHGAEPAIEVQPIPAVSAPPEAPSKQVVPESSATTPKVADAATNPDLPDVERAREMEQVPSATATATAPAAEQTAVTAGSNRFRVTVGPKQPSHPAAGKGHPMGFLIDGVSGKELVVERGKTYSFDISSDAKHDVYLSTKAIGWGGSPLSAGVQGAYTYKGTMTFTPTEKTPDDVYYACRNHPYMGARIHVVDPGETVTLSQPVASQAGGGKPGAVPDVTEAKVKQKLMFAQMMIGSQGAKRVEASNNAEAKKLLADARKALADGRAKSSAGALAEALSLANRALKLVGTASRMVPSEEVLAEQAHTYNSLLAEIADYEKSYQANLKGQQKKGDVPDDVKYDEKAVAKLKADAKALADKDDYVRASALLRKVQTTLTEALHRMLDSKTLVYDLKFETAADEYAYELKRFGGYEELIPIAIEAKKPAPGAIKLMESFVDKARKRRDEAQAKADAGDYGSAISMMQQATKTVRRALRMVGVTQ